MNKKVVFPLVISALLLAGCNNQGESTPNLVLKEVPMHMVNIGAADKDGQIDLTKEEKTNFRLYFDEKEPLTPYVNVAEAFRYYIDNVENLISSETADNRSYQITLANKNKDEFQFVIGNRDIGMTVIICLSRILFPDQRMLIVSGHDLFSVRIVHEGILRV